MAFGGGIRVLWTLFLVSYIVFFKYNVYFVEHDYKFGNTSVQCQTYHAVGKFPFHNDYTSEKTRCLCALFHSCKHDQTAGSGFTIVSQSPFLFERINIWML